MPLIDFVIAKLVGAAAAASLIGIAGTAAVGVPAAASVLSPSLAQQSWLDDQESLTHKYSLSDAVAQATRFNLISALPGTYKAYVKDMKAANPNLKIAAYMNGTMAPAGEVTTAPESWFLHDAQGHRLMNVFQLYLMDPANPAWIQSRVQTCATLVQQSGYDGCFLDNLGVGTLFGGAIDPATGKIYTGGDWLARSAHIADVVGAQTGKLVFGNGLINGSAYFSQTAPSSVLLRGSQIGCAEGFLRSAGQSVTSYRTVQKWQQDVDMLANAAAQGRGVAAIVKVWTTATQQQIDSWHRFALGSFLLGADTGQYFEFSASRATLDAGDDFLPRLAGLGLPTGHYTVVNGVYERPFSGGMVVVNPNSSPLTIPLAKTYTGSLSGWKVSGSLTVNPHEAWFLLG